MTVQLNSSNRSGGTIGVILAGILQLVSSKAFAQETLVLHWLKTDFQNLTLSEKGKLQGFLKTVDQLAPALLKQSIQVPLSLGFASARLALQNDEPLPDPCKAQRSFPLAYSQVRKNKIELSPLLLREILKGPDLATRFSCGHRNYYRFAQATLLHELTHFYDHSNSISDSRQFRYLSGWDYSGFIVKKWTQENQLTSKSPDAYEFKSPQESLAISMEFFLLDPDFKCRKPALYQYLSDRLGHIPFSNATCTVQNQIAVSSLGLDSGKIKWVNLDPNRVYQIHYLYASQGQSPISRWGHAMIRVVLCNPHRTEVGPACLEEDVNSHLVLSYRANLETLDLSPWKMLTQLIPSQLFVIPLTDIVNEYTRDELRDLVSVPLDLSPAEQTSFIHRTLEQFWSFRGNYSIIRQNCATLALQHLKGALTDQHIKEIKDFHAITPLKLYKKLTQLACTQPEEWSELFNSKACPKDSKSAERKGFLFKSKLDQLNDSFDELKKFGNLFPFKDINDYLHLSAAAKRFESFQQVLALNPSNKTALKIGARFFVLEAQVLRFLRTEYFKKISDNLSHHPQEHSELIKKYQEIQSAIQPWQLLPFSYGIPTATELNLEAMEAVIKSSENYFTDHQDLIEKVTEAFSDIRKEIEHSTQNAVEFRKTIRQSAPDSRTQSN